MSVTTNSSVRPPREGQAAASDHWHARFAAAIGNRDVDIEELRRCYSEVGPATFIEWLILEFRRQAERLAGADDAGRRLASEIRSVKRDATEQIRQLQAELAALRGAEPDGMAIRSGPEGEANGIGSDSGEHPAHGEGALDGPFLAPFYEASGMRGDPVTVWRKLSATCKGLPSTLAEAEKVAAIVRESGLLDIGLYGARLPDGMDPALHYAVIGERLGWPPSDLFDPYYYSRRNPDIAANGMSPLVHYVSFGRSEKRQPKPALGRLAFPRLPEDHARPVVVILGDITSAEGGRAARNLCRGFRTRHPVIAVLLDKLAAPKALSDVSDIVIGPLSLPVQPAIELEAVAEQLTKVYQPLYAVMVGIETVSFAAALGAYCIPTIALIVDAPRDLSVVEANRRGFDWTMEIVFLTHTDAESFFALFPWIRTRRGVHVLPPGAGGTPLLGDVEPGAACSDATKLLDTWGRAASERRFAEEAKVLRDSGLIDQLLAMPRGATPPRGTTVENHILFQWIINSTCVTHAGNLSFRRPVAGFNPQVYAVAHRDACERKERNPTAHWLQAGRPDGPWMHPVFSPDQFNGRATQGLRVAIHAHFYYPELVEDFARRLAGNQTPCDLFISTDTPEKARRLSATLAEHFGKVMVLVMPNRGRDIAPLLTGFGSEVLHGRYDLWGHVHGKRSAWGSDYGGDVWRHFLWESLIGGRYPMLDFVASLFKDNQQLGLAFAEDPYLGGWEGNKEIAKLLARRMGLNDAFPDFFDFPMGTMFWFRPAALRKLFTMNLTWDAYPEEPVARDGTMLHALERLVPFIAASELFDSASLRVPGITR